MPSRKKQYGNASQVTTHVDSYADGGMVKKTKKNKATKKPKPSMLGSGGAAKAGEAVSGRQRQIDKALEDAGA